MGFWGGACKHAPYRTTGLPDYRTVALWGNKTLCRSFQPSPAGTRWHFSAYVARNLLDSSFQETFAQTRVRAEERPPTPAQSTAIRSVSGWFSSWLPLYQNLRIEPTTHRRQLALPARPDSIRAEDRFGPCPTPFRQQSNLCHVTYGFLSPLDIATGGIVIPELDTAAWTDFIGRRLTIPRTESEIKSTYRTTASLSMVATAKLLADGSSNPSSLDTRAALGRA